MNDWLYWVAYWNQWWRLTLNLKRFDKVPRMPCQMWNGLKSLHSASFPSILPRTTDTQRELFFENHKILGLGRQIGPQNFGAFWVFLADLSATILVLCVSCPYFSLISYYFSKTKPLYPNPKNLLNLGRKELDIYSSCVRSPWSGLSLN